MGGRNKRIEGTLAKRGGIDNFTKGPDSLFSEKKKITQTQCNIVSIRGYNKLLQEQKDRMKLSKKGKLCIMQNPHSGSCFASRFIYVF